jgi:S-adenosylmethionine:tRNA ribosyltransferase-isomerase
MFSLTDYDYDLPEERIAQVPIEGRDGSKLLVLNRFTGEIAHHTFLDIYDLLCPSDVLVINNTEVIPGRLLGHKESGGKAEVLILDYPGCKKNRIGNGECFCRCLIKTSKRPKGGTTLIFNQDLKAKVIKF